jgi:hypothetical protein
MQPKPLREKEIVSLPTSFNRNASAKMLPVPNCERLREPGGKGAMLVCSHMLHAKVAKGLRQEYIQRSIGVPDSLSSINSCVTSCQIISPTSPFYQVRDVGHFSRTEKAMLSEKLVEYIKS